MINYRQAFFCFFLCTFFLPLLVVFAVDSESDSSEVSDLPSSESTMARFLPTCGTYRGIYMFYYEHLFMFSLVIVLKPNDFFSQTVIVLTFGKLFSVVVEVEDDDEVADVVVDGVADVLAGLETLSSVISHKILFPFIIP